MSTQKIVINRCYGGFGLSAKAIQRLAELQGKPCYFLERKLTNDGKHVTTEYIPTDVAGTEKAFSWSAYTVPDVSDLLADQNRWSELTNEERTASNARWNEITLSDFHDDRANPLLVQVVEELGEEVASDRFAKLKVVEIPAGIEWEIDEYDGLETVEEVHCSWS